MFATKHSVTLIVLTAVEPEDGTPRVAKAVLVVCTEKAVHRTIPRGFAESIDPSVKQLPRPIWRKQTMSLGGDFCLS